MGCVAPSKRTSVNSVLTQPILETPKTRNTPKMNRIIKMFNWKSNLRPIAEANPFMEFSSSVEAFR